MTESEPAFAAGTGAITHRRVLAIALPIVLSNATVPILGIVDTAVVGQIGQAAPIGAVGIGAIILTAFYWVFGFLRMGTTGMVGQARGAGNTVEVSALLVRALIVAGAVGAAAILLQGPLFAGAFRLSPASPEVETLARQYLSIRIWSAPAAVALYGLTGWLIALERTRAVLLLQVVMNLVNIGLDFTFVLGMGWGVQGVAAATFIAEWSGVALGLWLCRDAFRGGYWLDRQRIFDRERLLHMATVNGDIFIRSLLLQGIFVTFLFLAADLGDVALAANQVLLQFLQVTAYALDGFAFSAEALVAQAIGQGSRPTLRRAALATGLWGAVSVAVLALGFALMGNTVIALMTTAPDVRDEARLYLPWMVALPLIGVLPWMLDGIFIGATRTRDMRNMMILSALVYALGLSILYPIYGNHGLWASLALSFVARGATLGLRYPALEAAVRPRPASVA
ncbi:MATE family efflux transporter [Aliiruegeria lutimaris]|uniref:Multidrug resistance protein, MATE family n=1 Tax=Aliiruegeria lutimaris TaxID=571298 RepID=A0A1G9E936_9RHOB|nr:MATE family efflux transporter [Aliiruegeria lutimaris]SDK72669.1 multidrug resistance protein, MATE family [Aliiruegeria lutimaris]